MKSRDQLISIFNAGIAAVSGKASVINAFKQLPDLKPDCIIAVGKAASSMCLGALAVFGDSVPALVVTKYHHSDPTLCTKPNVTLIEAAHPIPDDNSLNAGKKILGTVSTLTGNSTLVLLISGGASAVAECLSEDITLSELQNLTNQMIASGLSINAINKKRKEVSLIKDGRLLENFNGKEVIVFAISDVEGDSISTIGAGIGDINRTHVKAEVNIIASNAIARNASATEALELNLAVKQNIETLYDDVFSLSKKIGTFIRNSEKGLYLWGGEPTIQLPENPKNGGRNQSLALALAKEIKGTNNITILVAGTDGTDGPTRAAGAIVNGFTFRHEGNAQAALDSANAGDYLNEVGDLLITGPTGTNVMDLLIALVD